MKIENKIVEQIVKTMKMKGYATRTQQLYLKWINEFINFHGKNPQNMGIVEIDRFKNYLERQVIISNELRKQASQAILFLYTQVLKISLQNDYIQAARDIKPQKRKMVQSVMVF
jgi:hypothetical protein